MTDLLNNFIVSEGNTKMKRNWGIHFFNNINIKWSTWVSYSFKAALDYSSLYRSMILWYYPEKLLSIEKLNLTWHTFTKLNKLGPLPKVFQIVLRRRGWEICLRTFDFGMRLFYQVEQMWFWPLKLFFKTKTNVL